MKMLGILILAKVRQDPRRSVLRYDVDRDRSHDSEERGKQRIRGRIEQRGHMLLRDNDDVGRGEERSGVVIGDDDVVLMDDVDEAAPVQDLFAIEVARHLRHARSLAGGLRVSAESADLVQYCYPSRSASTSSTVRRAEATKPGFVSR